MNRLYAYIVRWDDGFAPNPFMASARSLAAST